MCENKDIILDTAVKKMLDEGLPSWQIRTYGVSPKRITRISQGIASPPRGKPKKFSDQQCMFVIGLVMADPEAKSKDLRKAFENKYHMTVSSGQISKWLNKCGFSCTKPMKVQELKDYQIVARYNFAIETLQFPDSFFEHLVFSDESRFCANPDSARIYRKKGCFDEKYCTTFKKFAPSCMIWGAIGKDFKSNIVFVGTLNSHTYWEMLEQSEFFDQAASAFEGSEWYFEQDGATCHTAEDVINKILERCHLLSGWPPNSPDLSPIEMMWAIIKFRINSYKEIDRPKTVEDLKKAIQKEWDSISIEVVNKLVASFKKRLMLCVNVGGRSISHIIKYTRDTLPESLIVAEEDRPQRFTPQLDSALMKEFEEHGRQWTLIGRNVSLDPHLVKYRVLQLLNQRRDDSTPKIGQKKPDDDPKTLDDDETNEEELDEATDEVSYTLKDIHPLHQHDLDIDMITNDENEEENTQFVTTQHSDDDILLTAANTSE